ncbi:ABC transporter ATP-binding protein [Clostridium sp. 19966]|uniref:ABC transporter ATP-binding protein n=1 Tax=Clostridium sp. 19966 TaxID=2768166 RepID=UPI0028DE9A5F|nr:ABC transporter ATP-binding protein [Clostridium sp. 19966]MDT8718346.1 ABC transporter ATP-binding protein [Clostridium sp. 19966]
MHNLIAVTKKARIPRRLLAVSLTLMGALGIIYVIESIYFGKVIDAASGNMKAVIPTIMVIILITIGEYILGIITKYTVPRASEIGLYNLRNSLSKKICHLKYKVFDETSTGDILSRTMSDLNGVGTFWSDTFINAFQGAFIFLTGLCVCIYISWQLTLIGFIFIPIVSYVVFRTSFMVEKASFESKTFSGKMNALAHNILTGMMTLKSFTLEDILTKKFIQTSREFVKAEKRVGKASAKVYALGALIDYGPNIAVIIFAGIMSLRNQLTSGEYLSFTFTFGFVSSVLYDCQKYIISLRSSEAMAKRLMDVYEYAEEKQFDIKNIKASKENMIEISKLNFSYDGTSTVLKNINLNVRKGEVVAFVGSSGCGKSTLVKLISGMYDLEEGSVTVAGFNLREENLPSLRSNIAIVAQESFLFPGTILQNIRYGNPKASEEDIYEACKKADIHDFIMQQPDKYLTVVGEKGLYMSGGQRQRLAIARAFLKNADILILDEPTSALDSEAEKNIQETLDKLMVGKTVIVVAHRLSTIRNANVIYVFDKGSIVESGTHEELVAKKSFYYKLYEKQFEENKGVSA